jgi:hypothetical protein
MSKGTFRNRTGSISITTIFFVMFFAMILAMVMNVGRHANRKIVMQNGSDAAAYSGGVVLARSMNTLVFTNHLLCDVFGVTAYLREARDRKAEQLAIRYLNQALRDALRNGDLEWAERIRLEMRLVRVFGNRNAVIAARLLPVFEGMLQQEQIPVYQRSLVESTPYLALAAANEIADRQAPADAGLSGGIGMQTMLWRTDATTFDYEPDDLFSTLPVVDPLDDQSETGAQYLLPAIDQRSRLSRHYLRSLNRRMFQDMDRTFMVSGYPSLWRHFSRLNLDALMEEYPRSNLLFQLRQSPDMTLNLNAYIERETMFIGVSYWNSMPERLPGLFGNPMDADDQAYTQIRLFMPRGRLIYDPTQPIEYQIYREHNRPRSLLEQGWTTQIVPATSAIIPTILEIRPANSTAVTPNLGGINVEEYRRLNTH